MNQPTDQPSYCPSCGTKWISGETLCQSCCGRGRLRDCAKCNSEFYDGEGGSPYVVASYGGEDVPIGPLCENCFATLPFPAFSVGTPHGLEGQSRILTPAERSAQAKRRQAELEARTTHRAEWEQWLRSRLAEGRIGKSSGT